MADVALSLQVLGGFRLLDRGRPIAVPSERVRSLLTYLVLRRGVSQHRARLAALFWPDSTDEQARTNLRKLVLELRRTLPLADRCLRVDGAALVWRDDAPCAVDVVAFEDAASQEASPVALEQATKLYRGDLLPGCYDEWVLTERERLRQRYCTVLERRAAVLEARGAYAEAIGCARQLLEQDPLREEAYRLLMRLHAAAGDRAAAVRVYHRCEAVLRRELDVAPSPATREAYARVLHAGARPLDEPATLPPSARHNLPRHLTSFVGRAREIVDVVHLLADAPLVTLTGAPGCGKTRLALRVAADLVDSYHDGVWLVELAPIADPALVLRAVASALDVRELPGQSLAETLVTVLREKRLLLVLDNCEHVGAACGQLATILLSACSAVRILASSRHALKVPGEALWRVPPLSMPGPGASLSPEALLEYDAIRLFVERAAAVRPAFRLGPRNAPVVAELCRRLDGLPLAIELAAARMQALTPQQIVTRLENRFRLLRTAGHPAFSRHQTLETALAWSHDLLSDPERRLLRRLSAFAGGATLEAAEAVCTGDGLEADEVLGLLAELVDKSLVFVETQGEEARYRLLETVRQYARDRLREAGEAEVVARRHRDWYVALADRAQPHLTGPEQGIWLDRLEAEHPNLRAALRWSLDGGDADTALRLATVLRYFWAWRGHLTEGRTWLEEGLRFPPSGCGTIHIDALNVAGQLAAYQGDYTIAQALLEHALGLAREAGDQHGTVRALVFLGYVHAFRGACEQAGAVLEEALALSRGLGSRRGEAYALEHLAITAAQQGDYARSRALRQQALEAFRELGDKVMVARALHNLGHVILCQGEYGVARPIFEECLGLFRALQDRRGIAYAAINLGIVFVHKGARSRASALLGESLTIVRSLGEKRAVCNALEGCAILAAARGDGERAATLLGAVEVIRETIAMPRRVNDRDRCRYDHYVAMARAAVGDEAFEATWTQGRAKTLWEAVEYARGAEAEAGDQRAVGSVPAREHAHVSGAPQALQNI